MDVVLPEMESYEVCRQIKALPAGNRTRWRFSAFAPPARRRRVAHSVTVRNLPPGTSQWNRIEHRLFSFITQNWRGKPLVSLEIIVRLIAATTTESGLKVRFEVDPKTYPAGVKVTNREMDAIVLEPHSFHGDWNYTIRPNTPGTKR